MAPKPVDAQALAEDVRKLIKRVDELENEKKNLVKKSAEHETELKILRNRGNDLNYKAEAAEKRASDLETKLKAVYVYPFRINSGFIGANPLKIAPKGRRFDRKS